MPAGALPYQSDGDIIFYRAREATASVSPHDGVCAFVGARAIRFSGMAGSVVHLLEQPRPGCDRVLPHSPEPSRGAGRADRNEARRVRGDVTPKTKVRDRRVLYVGKGAFSGVAVARSSGGPATAGSPCASWLSDRG